MKMNLFGKEIHIDDDVVSVYNKTSGKMDEKTVKMLLTADGIDAMNMDAATLENAVNKSIKNELETRERLSRPEMIQKAREFAQM